MILTVGDDLTIEHKCPRYAHVEMLGGASNGDQLALDNLTSGIDE